MTSQRLSWETGTTSVLGRQKIESHSRATFLAPGPSTPRGRVEAEDEMSISPVIASRTGRSALGYVVESNTAFEAGGASIISTARLLSRNVLFAIARSSGARVQKACALFTETPVQQLVRPNLAGASANLYPTFQAPLLPDK